MTILEMSLPSKDERKIYLEKHLNGDLFEINDTEILQLAWKTSDYSYGITLTP